MTKKRLEQLSDAELRDLVANIFFHEEAVAAEEQLTMRFLEQRERERTVKLADPT